MEATLRKSGSVGLRCPGLRVSYKRPRPGGARRQSVQSSSSREFKILPLSSRSRQRQTTSFAPARQQGSPQWRSRPSLLDSKLAPKHALWWYEQSTTPTYFDARDGAVGRTRSEVEEPKCACTNAAPSTPAPFATALPRRAYDDDGGSLQLPQTIAHRGYRAAFPENTLRALAPPSRPARRRRDGHPPGRGTRSSSCRSRELSTAQTARGRGRVHPTDGGRTPRCARCFGDKARLADYDWSYVSGLQTLQEPRQHAAPARGPAGVPGPARERGPCGCCWTSRSVKCAVLGRRTPPPPPPSANILRQKRRRPDELIKLHGRRHRRRSSRRGRGAERSCSARGGTRRWPCAGGACLGSRSPSSASVAGASRSSEGGERRRRRSTSTCCSRRWSSGAADRFMQAARGGQQPVRVDGQRRAVDEWSIRRGVDGVVTDDPARFLAVCRGGAPAGARGRRRPRSAREAAVRLAMLMLAPLVWLGCAGGT